MCIVNIKCSRFFYSERAPKVFEDAKRRYIWIMPVLKIVYLL